MRRPQSTGASGNYSLGHYLVWENGRVHTAPYWQLDFCATPWKTLPPRKPDAICLTLLDDAVRLRMDCDVPYGAYLSGGVDSSSVTTLMCRHQSQPVTTFSLGYAEPPSGQFADKMLDVEYARLMSQRLGTSHHEFILSSEEFAERLPEVLQSFDEPFSGTVSTFFLSILIHQHVKVALSGDGADELFGSYLSHRLARGPCIIYLESEKAGQGKFCRVQRVGKRTPHAIR